MIYGYPLPPVHARANDSTRAHRLDLNVATVLKGMDGFRITELDATYFGGRKH